MPKIDIATHILPLKYKKVLYEKTPPGSDIIRNISATPTLSDLDHRFRIMDKFDGLMQVLTVTSPPIEEIVGPEEAVDLAKLANDSMAELIDKYPERFVAGVACLPMNNPDAMLEEADRAIKELKFRGVEVHTPINDKPLDAHEFLPLYEKMSQYDLPIWIHPWRSKDYRDYRTEKESLYRAFSVFGWLYETTIAMTRLVFSGILERYPNLKFITHHSGAMVPFFRERIIGSYDRLVTHVKDNVRQGLTKPHIEYFKLFYNDTAINGNTSALMCAHEFCGADHLLFGTDMPFDTEYGERNLRQVTEAIQQMNISGSEKEDIFWGNAKRLLNLQI
jgi:aminocarboxymuconate-semialdehyde decarboxylase